MRDLFPGHYRPSASELKHLWQNALFIFDTNVLLNLYSYPEEAREIFLTVLRSISDRVWIPYQVALEFHRNRLSRIKSSNKAILALREKLKAATSSLEIEFKNIEFDKRNTGISDIEERLAAVRAANEGLVDALTAACERLPGTSLEDPIGAQIADLFDGKVGPAPKNQAELDEITKDAEVRFMKKVPPGFKDGNKNEEYSDREINYHAKFGDLILWRQTIKHVQEIGKQEIVFVTGDRKEDWWDLDEGKIRGPLPDLICEFRGKTQAKLFWMYTVDVFLQNAKDYLKSKEITAETIAQVKETADHVSQYQDIIKQLTKDAVQLTTDRVWKSLVQKSIGFRQPATADPEPATPIYRAIGNWLQETNPEQAVSTSLYPDFIVAQGNDIHGYEVAIAPEQLKRNCVFSRLTQGDTAISSGILTRYSLILAIDLERIPGEELRRLSMELTAAVSGSTNTIAIIGTLLDGVFKPLMTFGHQQK